MLWCMSHSCSDTLQNAQWLQTPRIMRRWSPCHLLLWSMCSLSGTTWIEWTWSRHWCTRHPNHVLGWIGSDRIGSPYVIPPLCIALCHMSYGICPSFIHVYALPTLCIITDHQMIVICCRYSILSLNSHLLTHFISFASQVMLWYFIDGLINILLSFESNQRAHARFVFILYPNHSLIPILIPFPLLIAYRSIDRSHIA